MTSRPPGDIMADYSDTRPLDLTVSPLQQEARRKWALSFIAPSDSSTTSFSSSSSSSILLLPMVLNFRRRCLSARVPSSQTDSRLVFSDRDKLNPRKHYGDTLLTSLAGLQIFTPHQLNRWRRRRSTKRKRRMSLNAKFGDFLPRLPTTALESQPGLHL